MTETHQTSFKTQHFISATVLTVGLLLLVFMITVENEPGALPLALIVGGLVWQLVIRRKQKLSNR